MAARVASPSLWQPPRALLSLPQCWKVKLKAELEVRGQFLRGTQTKKVSSVFSLHRRSSKSRPRTHKKSGPLKTLRSRIAPAPAPSLSLRPRDPDFRRTEAVASLIATSQNPSLSFAFLRSAFPSLSFAFLRSAFPSLSLRFPSLCFPFASPSLSFAFLRFPLLF